MRKTVDLQPKIKAIQAKYKNDKEKANAAVMELYKEHNVNPMGGCLPIVVQLPIFWVYIVHYVILNMILQILLHAHMFLGFDLTEIYGFTPTYHLILPIFAAATTYLQTKVTNPNASTDPTQKIDVIHDAIIFCLY